MQQLLKTVVVIVLILGAGAVLRSVGVVQDTEVWYWTLSDLVKFAMFTAAALLAGGFASQLPMRGGGAFFQSQAFAPPFQAVVAGLIVWFVYIAAQAVVLPDWLGILNTIFAIAMVAVAGYLVWRVYTGFDALAAEFKRLSASATPRPAPPPPPAAPTPSATPPVSCPQCGAAVAPGKKFCGDCGATVA